MTLAMSGYGSFGSRIVILQRSYCDMSVTKSLYARQRRTRRSQGRDDRHIMLQSRLTNREAFRMRLSSRRRVDHECDFAIFDHVGHVRPTFGQLQHRADLQPLLANSLGCGTRRKELESQL